MFVCVWERKLLWKGVKSPPLTRKLKTSGRFHTGRGKEALISSSVDSARTPYPKKPPSQWLLEQHPMQRRLQNNCRSFSLMAARWEILIWCNSVIDHSVCCYCNCDLEKKGNGSSVVRSKISVYCLNYRQKWDAVVTLKLSNGCYLNFGVVETHPTVNPK